VVQRQKLWQKVLENEKEQVGRSIKTSEQVNEPSLQSLVTIEKLLLETVRFLDNCPLRDERWVKRQIVDLGEELEHIQELIQNEVFIN
jgi:hypothetical protein